MAATSNRSLFLQVSGDVSNLQASMKAGRTAILALADAAGDVQKEVQQALANISTDPNALKQLESSYRATFDNIRRNAQQALSSNDNQSALGIINASGAQQQAAAAAAQASQLRLAADAAASVAERQGEAGVAARVLAAALEVQAIDAAKVATALRGQADVLAEVAAEAKRAGASEDELGGSHARMGASGLIAEHVVRSFSDSVAAGQSPVRALTIEMGRITEALTLFAQTTDEKATGALGKFASFMGGPWGLAISVAVAVLTPLVAKLIEGGDAADEQADKLKKSAQEMDAAVSAADSFGTAQSQLSKIIDLTTGSLKTQNSVLVETIRLQAQQRLNDAKQAERDDAKKLTDAAEPGVFAGRSLGTRGVAGQTVSNERVQRIFQRYLGGGSREDALAAINHLSATQLGGLDPLKLQGLILKVGADRNDQTAQQQVLDVINGKPIPDDLKPYKKPKTEKAPKPTVDHSAERAANADRAYQTELGQAQDRVSRATLALADTAEGRYRVEADQLIAAERQKNLEIDDQLKAGKINGAEAAKLKALNEEVTGLQLLSAARDRDSAIATRAFEVSQAQLDAQIALDQIDEQLATTRKARLALELKLLREREQKEVAAQQRIIDDPKSTPDQIATATTAIGNIRAQANGNAKVIEQQNADPLTRYKQQLHADTDDMSEALNKVKADGLQAVEDGLIGIVSGTESVKQAFSRMAESILADLARIAIEKAIVSVFGFDTGVVEAPGHAAGIVAGFASGIVRGPGNGTSDSIPAWMDGVGAVRVSNGESIITAQATRDNAPWLRAMNRGLKLPAFATGFVGDMPAIPTSYPALPEAASLRRPGNDNRPLSFDLRGAVLTADLLQQMQVLAAQSGGTAYVEAVRHTNQSIAGLSRRTL